jgi:hypothetical protein
MDWTGHACQDAAVVAPGDKYSVLRLLEAAVA